MLLKTIRKKQIYKLSVPKIMTIFTNAEFTLEMSLIFPVVLMAIISNIYFSFYVQDRIQLQCCAYETALDNTFTNEDADILADTNTKKLSLFTVSCVGADTDKGNVNETCLTGLFSVPLSAMSIFLKDEEISETGYAVPKMDLNNMLLFNSVVEIPNF